MSDADSDRRRAALVLAAGLVPWAIIPYETGAALLFSFGQVTSTPLVVQPVTRYLLRGGPLAQPLLAWPMATFLYVLGVVSAGLSLVGAEDRRVTAGLFALAGLDLLYFAVAFSSVRLRVVAIPVGVVLLWLVAWTSRPRSWGV
ncbi:MAG: TIGR04206 family protein [Haloarculaceae archaeon]